MATKRETTQKLFRELINLQLEPHGKTYEDVQNEHDWYMNYRTTREEESKFMAKGVEMIRKRLRLSKTMAEREMSWFILQWGLKSTKIVNTAQSIEETQAFINKLKSSK